MVNLAVPLLTGCVALPLAAAGLLRMSRPQRHARALGTFACAGSFLLALIATLQVMSNSWNTLGEPGLPDLFRADALNVVAMSLFSGLALVTLVSSPRRDAGSDSVFRLLILTGSAMGAYSAVHPLLFLACWVSSTLPFLLIPGPETPHRRPTFELAASSVPLAAALLLRSVSSAEPFAFALMLLAVMLRTGLWPFHRTAVERFQSGSLLTAGLQMNSHLGVFLVLRFGLTLFPNAAPVGLRWLTALALLTAIYTAILGLVEREPRRLLALLFSSQAAAMLAGMMVARPEGTMGGLIQWLALAISSTVMISIYRAIEVRLTEPLAGDRLFGLGKQMPRLAVFFAINALAQVGLPGTLGFPGEDLLIHGVLSALPVWGLVLPVSIALNAWSLYRFFSRIFLGPPVQAWSGIPDALPRERWAFTACLVVLVAGGLMPAKAVALRTAAAEALNSLMTHSPGPVDRGAHPR